MQGKTTDQLRGSWHNFSKYRPLIRELVTRDLKVKYRRSFLGYVWSILNPLLMMLLQTLVFSYMFRFQIENFPLYLICGNTLFNFFNESTNMGMGSVLGNSSLIKKVYVPKFIFPISRVVSSFVNLLFSSPAAWRCCCRRWRSTSATCNTCTASLPWPGCTPHRCFTPSRLCRLLW